VRTADGITLAVSDHGPTTATHTVVFLHGLCLDRESWAHHVTDLINRYSGAVRIISYDHRGHGSSQPAPVATYHPQQLADDLATVLAELEVGGSVTIVGHSLGAMVALAYLGRRSNARPVQPDDSSNAAWGGCWPHQESVACAALPSTLLTRRYALYPYPCARRLAGGGDAGKHSVQPWPR
jgi:pimeloyl-ACP methyl ester carboxylesterase